MNDIMRGLGVEILLPDDDAFLKIKETLTRIGIESKKEKILFQTCHLLHKRKRYWICHFKELFELDGKSSTLSDNDIARRNTITGLLEDWGLCNIVHPEIIEDNCLPIHQIKIISFKDKQNYKLIAKYSIGNINK